MQCPSVQIFRCVLIPVSCIHEIWKNWYACVGRGVQSPYTVFRSDWGIELKRDEGLINRLRRYKNNHFSIHYSFCCKRSIGSRKNRSGAYCMRAKDALFWNQRSIEKTNGKVSRYFSTGFWAPNKFCIAHTESVSNSLRKKTCENSENPQQPKEATAKVCWREKCCGLLLRAAWGCTSNSEMVSELKMV